MVEESALHFYQELEKGFYLLGESPIAVLSGNKNGVAALAFETKEYANAFLMEEAEAILQKYHEIPEIVPIDNSYEFMQKCARHGYAGIELISEESQKSFIFCVRLEEVSSLLPTALSINVEGFSHIKTRFREYSEATYSSIKEWQRFDILDKTSASYSINSPFRQWKERIFYEIRPTPKMLGEIVYKEYDNKLPSYIALFNVPYRGHFNSLDGSIPFFTNIKSAIEFLNDSSFTSYIMGFYGLELDFEYQETVVDSLILNDYFSIVKVNDIRNRVQEIENPFSGFCINPNGQRDSTGYILKEGKDVLFYGVSGTWRIQEQNKFERINFRTSWDKNDTFFWNGINAYCKLPQMQDSSKFLYF